YVLQAPQQSHRRLLPTLLRQPPQQAPLLQQLQQHGRHLQQQIIRPEVILLAVGVLQGKLARLLDVETLVLLHPARPARPPRSPSPRPRVPLQVGADQPRPLRALPCWPLPRVVDRLQPPLPAVAVGVGQLVHPAVRVPPAVLADLQAVVRAQLQQRTELSPQGRDAALFEDDDVRGAEVLAQSEARPAGVQSVQRQAQRQPREALADLRQQPPCRLQLAVLLAFRFAAGGRDVLVVDELALKRQGHLGRAEDLGFQNLVAIQDVLAGL